MLATYKATSAELLKSLTFIPNGVIAVLVLAAAVVVALIVRRVADKLLRRVLSVRYPFLYSLLLRMEGPLRLALVLFALNIAVVIAPLDPEIGDLLGHLLRIAFISMIGWMVIGAFNIAADIYLRRYDIAAADNLLARKHVTQARILASAVRTLVVVITVAAALMTIPAVRQFGISLFASAGIAGIVVGLAARPMLSNLIAGIQLAVTQPIRLDDAVIIENEWGWIEEIGSTYVVVRLWDWRRMIVPLTYFIEKPFQNWTRESASLIGTVLLRLEFTAPIDRIRAAAEQIVKASKLWDGRVFSAQVTDSDAHSLELRVLASAATSGGTFDLRCEIREKLFAFLAHEIPEALPRVREEFIDWADAAGAGDGKRAPHRAARVTAAAHRRDS